MAPTWTTIFCTANVSHITSGKLKRIPVITLPELITVKAGDILTVAVSNQYQEDGAGTSFDPGTFRGTTADVLLEKVLPNEGVITVNGEYKNYGIGNGYSQATRDAFPSSGFSMFEGDAYDVSAMYLIPNKVWIGQFQPYVRYTNVMPSTSSDREAYEGGVNYVVDGHNAPRVLKLDLWRLTHQRPELHLQRNRRPQSTPSSWASSCRFNVINLRRINLMKKVMKKMLHLAAAVTLTVSAVGAGQAQAEETIKVGVLHSLSGTMAISETTLKDTMLMLIDEQNKKGGLLGKKLEAVVVDPASNWPLFAEKGARAFD